MPNDRPVGYVCKEDHWLRFAMRGVMTAGAAVVIGVTIWAAKGHDLRNTLVYSMCISMSCWLCIDLGRDVVSRLIGMPIFGEQIAKIRWQGWVWRFAILVVGALVGYETGNAIGNRITGLSEPGPFSASLQQSLALAVMALVPATVVTFFFFSREVIAAQRAEVERAERQAAEQQLKLLESQLEPHMLFNTLANLRALIAVDPPRAQAMLDRLIAFLRASLAGSRVREHSLAAEFERLRDYLDLMQIRMGPRLVTRFDLPESLASVGVPPLVLQPLVENSIKHGLEPKREGGRIDVVAERESDALKITVSDSGVGLRDAAEREGSAFGLAHIRERLATTYGPAASLTLAAAEDGEGGTTAIVRIPLTATGAKTAPAALAAGGEVRA